MLLNKSKNSLECTALENSKFFVGDIISIKAYMTQTSSTINMNN
jgi:hypothetical protein